MPLVNFRRRSVQNDTSTSTAGTVQVSDIVLRALLNSEAITRDKALTLPAVSSAVDLISGTIASMPVKLYHYVMTGEEDQKRRTVAEVERDPRTRALNADTADVLTGYELKKNMVRDYLLGKGGYAYVQRNRNTVTGLFYVQDLKVTPYVNTDAIFKTVVFSIGDRVYRDMDVLRILRNTCNGASGVGLTDEVSTCLQTAYATLLYQLKIAKSGGSKKGFLKADRRLGQKEIDELKNGWQNLFTNAEENAVVLNQGIDFKEAGASSVEMQLNQNKRTLTDEINSIFHIYPNNFDRTFKEAFYPIIKAFEASLNRTLLLESEKKNYFFEFDVKEILKANVKERYDAYGRAIKDGWKTINDVRREENMNAIEGMDVLNLGLNAVLYDTETHNYYTPNTNTLTDTKENTSEQKETNNANKKERTDDETA